MKELAAQTRLGRHSLPLPNFTRWHITSQDRLLFHLAKEWSTSQPRSMVDLGAHAAHGAYLNISDALLFLDLFGHLNGTVVVAVDGFEDFSLDLQRRFDVTTHAIQPWTRALPQPSLTDPTVELSCRQLVEPYASMPAIKQSLTRAIDCCRDDGQVPFAGVATMHAQCCADVWCHYGKLERERKADHLCRLTRMRLGLIPPEPWLPLYPSSYPLHVHQRLADPNTSTKPRNRYMIPSVTLRTLWRRPPMSSRRIDFLKVDVDTTWRKLGGLEELLAQKKVGVAVLEVDGSWGGVSTRWNLSDLDLLVWKARSFGYNAFLKVPCKARHTPHAGCCGSLELGSWRWNWKERHYRVAESTHGAYATWLFPLATVGLPFVPSRYHARRHNGVQDALLIDSSDDSLKELPTRLQRDCM